MQTQHHFDPKHLGIQVYDLLSRPGMDDRERAKIIAEALETVQQNYPDLGNTATKRDLSETELRLIDKIEMTRAEMKETELRLLDKIEISRAETKHVELSLSAQIKETELRLMGEIEKTRAEAKEIELRLTKEIGKQTMKTVGYLTAIMGLFVVILKFLAV